LCALGPQQDRPVAHHSVRRRRAPAEDRLHAYPQPPRRRLHGAHHGVPQQRLRSRKDRAGQPPLCLQPAQPRTQPRLQETQSQAVPHAEIRGHRAGPVGDPPGALAAAALTTGHVSEGSRVLVVTGTPETTMDPQTALFQHHRPRLFGLAYRMLGTPADAEDVLHDAWLRWHAQDSATLDDPEAWLVTVTTRLALDRLRRAKTERAHY